MKLTPTRIILIGAIVMALVSCSNRQYYTALSVGSGITQEIWDLNELVVYKKNDTVWVTKDGFIFNPVKFDTVNGYKFIIK